MFFTNVKIQRADTPNLNNRVYPRAVLEDAAKRAEGKTTVGMIGMPSYAEGGFDGLDLSKASHVVTNLHVEGDYLVGDVRVLDTPAGLDLERTIERGMDFRMAGVGSISASVEDGKTITTITDFTIHSINAVADGA